MDRETLARLAQPLDLRVVRHLPDNAGPGKAGKPYLPGWEHTRTANQVFVWEWSDTVLSHGLAYCEQVEFPGRNGGTAKAMWSVGYWALVQVTAGGVTHTGMGFCDSVQSNKGDACSMAYCGAVTEGRKSALEQFGDRFGLGLRDDTDPDGSKYSRELDTVGTATPPPLPPAPPAAPAPTPRAAAPAPAPVAPVAPPATAPAAVAPATAPAPAPAASSSEVADLDEAGLRKKLDEAVTLFWKATAAKNGKQYAFLPKAAEAAGIGKKADILTFPGDRIPGLLEAIRREWAEAGLKAA